MTRDETQLLLGILRTAHPRFYANLQPNSDEFHQTVTLWHKMLQDVPWEVANAAIYKLLATNEFPPAISEIRKIVADITNPVLPDEGEAWGEVIRAIRNYGYTRPEEALDSMSEPVRLAVKRMGWMELCKSENEIADRAHFMRIYSTMTKRIQEDRMIPSQLREVIEQLSEKFDCSNPSDKRHLQSVSF